MVFTCLSGWLQSWLQWEQGCDHLRRLLHDVEANVSAESLAEESEEQLRQRLGIHQVPCAVPEAATRGLIG